MMRYGMRWWKFSKDNLDSRLKKLDLEGYKDELLDMLGENPPYHRRNPKYTEKEVIATTIYALCKKEGKARKLQDFQSAYKHNNHLNELRRKIFNRLDINIAPFLIEDWITRHIQLLSDSIYDVDTDEIENKVRELNKRLKEDDRVIRYNLSKPRIVSVSLISFFINIKFKEISKLFCVASKRSIVRVCKKIYSLYPEENLDGNRVTINGIDRKKFNYDFDYKIDFKWILERKNEISEIKCPFCNLNISTTEEFMEHSMEHERFKEGIKEIFDEDINYCPFCEKAINDIECTNTTHQQLLRHFRHKHGMSVSEFMYRYFLEMFKIGKIKIGIERGV